MSRLGQFQITLLAAAAVLAGCHPPTRTAAPAPARASPQQAEADAARRIGATLGAGAPVAWSWVAISTVDSAPTPTVCGVLNWQDAAGHLHRQVRAIVTPNHVMILNDDLATSADSDWQSWCEAQRSAGSRVAALTHGEP